MEIWPIVYMFSKTICWISTMRFFKTLIFIIIQLHQILCIIQILKKFGLKIKQYEFWETVNEYVYLFILGPSIGIKLILYLFCTLFYVIYAYRIISSKVNTIKIFYCYNTYNIICYNFMHNNTITCIMWHLFI